MGAKSFSLVFDGGRTAPYHIIEKRGKFVGSLWLCLDNLKWLLQTWGLLRQSSELKGFFRFKRTEYSTLELSCLQNQRGRFVEVCKYHGGAQRGGIRVPEGYLGKGWNRFAAELESFFLGKQPPVELRADKSYNGKIIPNRKLSDSRDPPAKISHPAGTVTPNNYGISNILPRVDLDPDAIRPTRKCYFKWNPRDKTLRITKGVEGKRQVEWVGLKYKAHGLIQLANGAFPQAHGPFVGSGEPVRPEIQQVVLSSFDGSGEPVRPEIQQVDLSSSDNQVEALQVTSPSSSSSDESDEEEPASPAAPMGENLESPEVELPLTSAWVDLASLGQVSGAVVTIGAPFSDSQFDMGGTSNWEIEPTEVEGGELPIVLVNELDGDATSPLQCVPLASVGPPGVVDEVEELGPEPSQWVKWRHRGFCKLVGFPIERYEQECLAPLQRIEADRFANKPTSVPRCKKASGSKGKCELRSLISSVNYEGRQPVC